MANGDKGKNSQSTVLHSDFTLNLVYNKYRVWGFNPLKGAQIRKNVPVKAQTASHASEEKPPSNSLRSFFQIPGLCLSSLCSGEPGTTTSGGGLCERKSYIYNSFLFGHFNLFLCWTEFDTLRSAAVSCH